MSIEHDTILIWTRGDHTYVAEEMAKAAKEVYCYVPILGPHPFTRDDMIGSDLEGVEHIDNFEEYKDKADVIVFPGCYDGEKAKALHEEGRNVFSSMEAEEVELNRELLLDTMQEVGLPIPETTLVYGINEAIEFLKDKENYWIKTPYCRGDFDTIHFHNIYTHMAWFNWLRNKLGVKGSDEIKILIQKNLEAVCEGGQDRYCINGEYSQRGTVGYEVKDKAYIMKAVDKFPDILERLDNKMAPVYKKWGCQGAYSTEARITESGKAYLTDVTKRLGSPPGEGWAKLFKTFPKDIYDVAHGEMPKMETEKGEIYCAETMLSTWFNEDYEVCLDFPKDLKNNIKLHNHCKLKDHYYCLPNQADGFFGAVVATGKSVKEATEVCLDIAKEIKCIELNIDKHIFDDAQEAIKSGEKFGIII